MLGLGLASSHGAGIWRSPEQWGQNYERMPPERRNHLPYTAKVEGESATIREEYYKRIHDAFATMRDQLEAYKPDALIMIGDDQDDMFDMVNNPTFSIYTGEDPIWGVNVRDGKHGTNPDERERVYWQNHVELSRHLLKGLVKKGFDMANLAQFESRGTLRRGVSHMFANVAPEVNPARDIPTVGIFINEYFPPLPTAERCFQLGEAIGEVLAERPERIAIYASGGLSHFPGMFNAGWIDHALDRWILERLERNDVDALKNLFAMDSDMMRAGTGEVRAWISVAAAMNRPARVIDYVPAHSTVTGNGFVYWPPVESTRVDHQSMLSSSSRA